MSAFTYRPDPLDELPARAAAVLPDMALLPALARRIQVARRSGPLDPQLSLDIDNLLAGVGTAIDLAEAGHAGEVFDRSLGHLRQLASSIDTRLGARFAAVAADLEMQAGVSVQDGGAAPQDATPAWAAMAAVPVPTTPGSLADAAPPVILRTGFDDTDCGRVSGSFHMLDESASSPVAPAESVVVPANAYVRFEPGQVFILHATGWKTGERTDYPQRESPCALRLLAGKEGALVHGPAVIEDTGTDGKLILEMKSLTAEALGLPQGPAIEQNDLIAGTIALAGAIAGFASAIMEPDMAIMDLPFRIVVSIFSIFGGSFTCLMVGVMLIMIMGTPRTRLWFGRQGKTLQARGIEDRLNRIATDIGLQKPGKRGYRLQIGKFMARSSDRLEKIKVNALTGANFIPPARVEAMPGTRALRVLEPLKALPAPDPVTEDAKVVRLEPARR